MTSFQTTNFFAKYTGKSQTYLWKKSWGQRALRLIGARKVSSLPKNSAFHNSSRIPVVCVCGLRHYFTFRFP